MGCISSSRLQIRATIKSNPQKLMNIETTPSIALLNLITKIPSVKQAIFEYKPCRRIKVQKEFNLFITEDIQNNQDIQDVWAYNKDLYAIRKFWILFSAAKTNFEDSVHRVCITNYSIKNGVMVLIISAVASQSFKSINFSKHAPFITFHGNFCQETKKIIDAWNDFSKILKVIHDKEIVKKIETTIERLDQWVKENIGRKNLYAKKALKTAKSLVAQVNETIQGVAEISNVIKASKSEILISATQACAMSKFSGEKIVHYISN